MWGNSSETLKRFVILVALNFSEQGGKNISLKIRYIYLSKVIAVVFIILMYFTVIRLIQQQNCFDIHLYLIQATYFSHNQAAVQKYKKEKLIKFGNRTPPF